MKLDIYSLLCLESPPFYWVSTGLLAEPCRVLYAHD